LSIELLCFKNDTSPVNKSGSILLSRRDSFINNSTPFKSGGIKPAITLHAISGQGTFSEEALDFSPRTTDDALQKVLARAIAVGLFTRLQWKGFHSELMKQIRGALGCAAG
jgi:hypothetical protein